MSNENIQIIVPGKDEGDFAPYAIVVSRWTCAEPGMSPRSIEKVLSYFNEVRSVLIIDASNNALLAHAAIKWISTENPLLEIGSVIVDPNQRGNGYGTMATSATWSLAIDKYPNHQKIAFCNDVSLGIFKLLGAIEAKTNQLPSEVWDGCLKCSRMVKAKEAGKLCCDTIVVLPNTGPNKI